MSIVANLLSYVRRVFAVTVPGRVENFTGASGERIDTGDVLALSSALACVRLLAGNISALSLGVYQDKGDGHSIPLPAHPLWRLLHRAPNAEQTVVDFWEGGIASLELKGNMAARKHRGVRGDVVALTPLAWDYLTVTRNDSGQLVYRYGEERLGADDVLHIRGFGGAPEGGLSTIAIACETFSTAKAINKAASKMFANGVRSSGVLSTDNMLTGDQRTELEGLLVSKFEGAANAGRPMLLDNGLKWQALSINPDEAQMLESRGFSVEEVCRIFGVPPHMIGHTEKNSSWGTGIEQQTLAFQKFTLRPRLKRIETALEQQLLTPDDIAKGITIQFNLESLLRGDSAGRSAFYGSALEHGWMTINEVRAKEGLPPVTGGDVPRMQMQNVPITEAGQPVPAA